MAFRLRASGPITAREAAKQRRQLTQSLAKDLRAKDREKLRALRQAVRDARARRVQRIAEVRELCRTGRVTARERARERLEALRERQKREREEERERARAERKAAREVCASRGAVRAAATAELDAAKLEYQTKREEQASARAHTKAWTGKPKQTAADRARARREALAESDDEVRSDIPMELYPVWEKVKRGIHATPRMNRTEAFLQWVHDNSADVMHLIDEALAEDLARLEREELEHHRAMKKANRYRRSPAHMAGDLGPSAEEVPF